MRIEGETVIFGTDQKDYNKERRGDKPYTVRIMTDMEYVRLRSDKVIKIRIEDVFAQREEFFERHIRSIDYLGEILGHDLVGISWIHEEEKEMPDEA